MNRIEKTLEELSASGNLRAIPGDTPAGLVDLSSNDYLGLAVRDDLRDAFLDECGGRLPLMTSSASRLLAGSQSSYDRFESLLRDLYGAPALTFNSGYHANTGLVSSLADRSTLIVADRLVHASIIDGIRLSGAPFVRFRHNDYDHLEKILADKGRDYSDILIIAESVYSMDGDRADIGRLVDIKRSTPGAMLYIDEAHAVGVEGRRGLGMVEDAGLVGDVDVIVGTLGKALASVGAYAVVSPLIRRFVVNKARSLIFSTALPPANMLWSAFIMERVPSMTAERDRLRSLGRRLASILRLDRSSHIAPLVVGNPHDAVALSARLADDGFKVLPIRVPTVPPGTDRLRFSLSAALDLHALDRLEKTLERLRPCATNS